jgi:hypothetical protein
MREVRYKSETIMNAIMEKRAIMSGRSKVSEYSSLKANVHAPLKVTNPATAFQTLLRLEWVLTPMRREKRAMTPKPTAIRAK